MLAKIKSLFRKPKAYSLPVAVDQLDKLIEEYENILFALSTINKEVEFTKTDAKYADGAMFNLCSFRDELKIRLNNQKELVLWTRRNSHVNTLKQ